MNWKGYFDPRKEYGQVWWHCEDSTDTRMTTPCHDRGTPRMMCPFKGQSIFTMPVIKSIK
jgi:hypothetical protein